MNKKKARDMARLERDLVEYRERLATRTSPIARARIAAVIERVHPVGAVPRAESWYVPRLW